MFLKFSIVPFLLVSFLTLPRILTQSYIFLAIPTLIKSLNLTKIESQFIIPSMLLGTIIFLIPAGKFGDRFGPKKMLIISSWVYVFVSFIAAFCISGTLLLISLFFLGATAAFSMTQGSTYVSDIYPFDIRGRVIGTFAALITLTFFLGPVIGGGVAEIGQKGVFLVNLPFLLLGLCFSKFLPALHKEPQKDLKIEYKEFLNGSFISHCFISLFWQAIISLLIFFPAEYQIYLGLTPFEAGVWFSILALPFPIFSPVAGWIFDRVGSRIPYSIGYVSLFFAWFISYKGFSSESLVVLAFALAFVLPVTATASWGLFNQANRCSANSIYYLLRFVGSFIGSTVAGFFLVRENTELDFFFLNLTVAAVFGLLSLPAFLYTWQKR
jgi:MFS family permease